MSTSISINDDHRTRYPAAVTQSQAFDFMEGSNVPGTSVFPQATTMKQGLVLPHAQSVPDLQWMQNHLYTQQETSSVVPENAIRNSLETATFKVLSRQASSSSSSAQQAKKRKASNSARIRNELTMTQLPASEQQNVQSSTTETDSRPPNHKPNGAPSFTSQLPFKGQPKPTASTQFETLRTATSTVERPMFHSAPHSQSMQNLHALTPSYSGSDSIYPSSVPSPGFGPQGNSSVQGNAHIFTNPQLSTPGPRQNQRSPIIHKLTPAEGPTAGGIEVTCLGSGFYPGLEVMFGDAQAITTTFWGDGALVCLVPPAQQPGSVLVTFKHFYEQSLATSQSRLPTFKYNRDDEQMLMKHALALINQKWSGTATDAADSARNIISFLGSSASYSIDSSKETNQQRHQNAGLNAVMDAKVDLETAVLSCLNLVDLDDSPFHASLGAQGSNGQSMLHLSASLGYYRLTAGLLARGAHPDSRDNNGITPMHLASLRGHQRIIRKLRSAGADPTLRSLNGFTPADMATTQQARDASITIDDRTRSKSFDATSATHMRQASSAVSSTSSYEAHTRRSSNIFDANFVDGNLSGKDSIVSYIDQTSTPAHLFKQPRRNSTTTKQEYLADGTQGTLLPNASLFAANPALSALRDQLSAQIQQLQQSMHRTLPALQIPAFPPIPNLPDYQAHPVVRRISSLVPQRNSRPNINEKNPKLAKVTDYHWWEFLTGAAASPPAYEEIFPEHALEDAIERKASSLQAAGEALQQQTHETEIESPAGPSIMGAVDLGRTTLTKQEAERLRNAHARKVKKLRSDRKLFFIWVRVLY